MTQFNNRNEDQMRIDVKFRVYIHFIVILKVYGLFIEMIIQFFSAKFSRNTHVLAHLLILIKDIVSLRSLQNSY